MNWIIDALLFAGFLVAMLSDFTGLDLHQPLGVAIIALAAYHLLVHRRWVWALTRRFFERVNGRSRGVYLVDAGLMVCFLVICVTGLAISTWLSLPLGDYLAWRDAHVITSVVTLGLVTLKIGLHRRWIFTVAARIFYPAPARSMPSPSPMPVPATYSRRRFLGLMGIVGAAALSTGLNALADVVGADGSEPVVAGATPSVPSDGVAQANPPVESGEQSGSSRSGVPGGNITPNTSPRTDRPSANQAPGPSSPAPSAPVDGGGAAGQCVVQCPKRCSYPGRCRRYVDANGNRRCDLGECL